MATASIISYQAFQGSSTGGAPPIVAPGNYPIIVQFSVSTTKFYATWIFDIEHLYYFKTDDSTISTYISSIDMNTNNLNYVTVEFGTGFSKTENISSSASLSGSYSRYLHNYKFDFSMPDLNKPSDEAKYLVVSVGMGYNGVSLKMSRDAYLFVNYTPIPPHPPTNLMPNNMNANPRARIKLAWSFNPQIVSGVKADNLLSSEMRYRVNSGTWQTAHINNDIPEYEFIEDYFTIDSSVEWQARTQAKHNGWSEWSEIARFNLAPTPPLASLLVFPLNVSVSGVNGVLLEWRYNSPYDTMPTRFDARYRIDGGTWKTITNEGQLSVMTEPIHTQSRVEWQVMAFGSLGDAGPWSDIGIFFTIGVPNPPTIVQVSNSNRPTIYFSAVNLMSWEIEVEQNNIRIYQTGSQSFTGEFNHVVSRFFDNGNYLAKMRITNEYGLSSKWGALPFTINTTSPEALKLVIVSNPRFYMRLHFDNTGKTVYVYRSELRKNSYIRIAMTKGNVFDDYTARPRQRYEYFVRVVNPDFSFSDSNVVTGSLRFLQTTIAEYDNPQNMLMLSMQLDGKPTKNTSLGMEKTLTNFVGREFPVLQIGEHANKNLSLSFYCTIQEYEQLEELQRSKNVLILRDWRLGAVYGTISGNLSASNETDGCIVSFAFSKVDFNEEVELI